jgi:hypothetical protein
VEAPEVARQLSGSPKLMIIISWGVSGIHVIDYLPSGTPFDSTYFIDHILHGFNTLPIIDVAVRQKKAFVIHMDNSLIHKSKSVIAKISSMSLQLAPHPSYSPDLAPSDFFPSGHLKSQMIRREFDSPEDLIRAIRGLF